MLLVDHVPLVFQAKVSDNFGPFTADSASVSWHGQMSLDGEWVIQDDAYVGQTEVRITCKNDSGFSMTIFGLLNNRSPERFPVTGSGKWQGQDGDAESSELFSTYMYDVRIPWKKVFCGLQRYLRLSLLQPRLRMQT
jgi:hypothetical protein